MAFIRVFSEATNAIQQGAFRRGANMGVLRVDHPDIVDFINAKAEPATLNNFNLSVTVTDDFMRILQVYPDRVHIVYNPRNGQAATIMREDGHMWTVGEVFDLLAHRAWATGEPGIVFIDRINDANPTPHVGVIEATNACAEQPLLPYESCNLGSINIAKCVRMQEGKIRFDLKELRRVVATAVRFLDNVIDVNRYPIPQTAEITRANRKIGLGIMGLADTLCLLGIPYASGEAIAFGERVMSVLNEEAHNISQRLAEKRGVFPNWEGSRWASDNIRIRNASVTTVAPTGSISMIAGCNGGIEPFFSLVFLRDMPTGRHFLEINEVFERVARARGFYRRELMEEIAIQGSIQDMTDVPEDVQRVFATAHDIAPEWHVQMQAAFQRHCDASISKTVNLHHTASQDDVRRAFLTAFELGCKGVTVYRDKSRENQPMSLIGGLPGSSCRTGSCPMM